MKFLFQRSIILFSLFFFNYLDASWSPLVEISAENGGIHASEPRVACFSSERTLFLWLENSQLKSALYNKETGELGQIKTLLTENNVIDNPRIVFDAQGNGVATWKEKIGLNFVLKGAFFLFAEEEWSTSFCLSPLEENVLAYTLKKDQEGNASLVFVSFQEDQYLLSSLFLETGSLNWDNREEIHKSEKSKREVSLALDNTTEKMVVWVEEGPLGYSSIFVAYEEESGWDSYLLSEEAFNQDSPKVVLDKEGNAIVVWKGEGERGLFFLKGAFFFKEDKTWIPLIFEEKEKEEIDNLQLILDEEGNALLFFNGEGENLKGAFCPIESTNFSFFPVDIVSSEWQLKKDPFGSVFLVFKTDEAYQCSKLIFEDKTTPHFVTIINEVESLKDFGLISSDEGEGICVFSAFMWGNCYKIYASFYARSEKSTSLFQVFKQNSLTPFTTYTVTFTLNNQLSSALPNHLMSFILEGEGDPLISPLELETDSEGKGSFTITNKKEETLFFSLFDKDDNHLLQEHVPLSFFRETSPSYSKTEVIKKTAAADGVHFATIKVTLKDNLNNPVEGHRVKLIAQKGSSLCMHPEEKSNSLGEVIFQITNTKVENIVYTAMDLETGCILNKNVQLGFVALLDNTFSKLSVQRISTDFDGTASVLITLLLKDSNNTPLAGHKVELMGDKNFINLTPLVGVTDFSGKATFLVKNPLWSKVDFKILDHFNEMYLQDQLTLVF